MATPLLWWEITSTRHRGLLRGCKKGETQTRQNRSWRALSHVWDANASAENLGDAGDKRSRHGEQGGAIVW